MDDGRDEMNLWDRRGGRMGPQGAESALLRACARWDLSSATGLLSVVVALRESLDIEAVGIRIIDQDGNIPCEAQRGFADGLAFCRNLHSLERPECLCVRVLSERQRRSLPGLTATGSLVSGSMAQLRETLTFARDSELPANCPHGEYESVALVPIRGAGVTLGLIHCADHRTDWFGSETAALLEAVAVHIGRRLFLESIWPPAPWVPVDLESPPQAVCPVCGRRRKEGGHWMSSDVPSVRLTEWSVRPTRRVICPDCLTSTLRS